jgi:hypothetical protein
LLRELSKRQVTEILVMDEGVTIAANQAEEEIRGDEKNQIMAVVLEMIVVMIHGEKNNMVVLVETILGGVKIIDSSGIIPEIVVIIVGKNLMDKDIIVVAMEAVAENGTPTMNAKIVMIRGKHRPHHPRRETREVLGVRRHHS